jgi:hypothetical protein
MENKTNITYHNNIVVRGEKKTKKPIKPRKPEKKITEKTEPKKNRLKF